MALSGKGCDALPEDRQSLQVSTTCLMPRLHQARAAVRPLPLRRRWAPQLFIADLFGCQGGNGRPTEKQMSSSKSHPTGTSLTDCAASPFMWAYSIEIELIPAYRSRRAIKRAERRYKSHGFCNGRPRRLMRTSDARLGEGFPVGSKTCTST